jgi:hypothetical protein
MAYTARYKHGGCFQRDQETNRLVRVLPMPRGTISIEELKKQVDRNGVSQVDKYNLAPGQITPNTCLLIIE